MFLLHDHLVVVSGIHVAFLWKAKLASSFVVCLYFTVLFHLCSFASACQKVKKKKKKTNNQPQTTKPVAEIAAVLVFSSMKMSAYDECF